MNGAMRWNWNKSEAVTPSAEKRRVFAWRKKESITPVFDTKVEDKWRKIDRRRETVEDRSNPRSDFELASGNMRANS